MKKEGLQLWLANLPVVKKHQLLEEITIKADKLQYDGRHGENMKQTKTNSKN